MRTEQASVEALTVFQAPALDPILIVLQDFGGGRGRLLLECYGLAWSTWFGAYGDGTLKGFITSCGADYLANRMWPPKQRRTKADYGYLVRVVEATQKALRDPL